MCAVVRGCLRAFSIENTGEMNTFEATNHYFREAARIMELPERVQTLLINPDREVKVEVSIQLDK